MTNSAQARFQKAVSSLSKAPKKSAIDFANALVGKREVPDRAVIKDYLTNGGANLDPATTAWCAAYVNASLGHAGVKGTGSNLARSFLNWGQAVEKPQRGDVAVYTRGDPNGPYGHVGFVDGVNPDGSVQLLAGNQGNAVSIKRYGSDGLLGYRRAQTSDPEGLVAPPPSPSAPDAATVQLPDVNNTAAPVATAPVNAAAMMPLPVAPRSPFADVFEAFARDLAQQQQPVAPAIGGGRPRRSIIAPDQDPFFLG